jgi:hypothetical protein
MKPIWAIVAGLGAMMIFSFVMVFVTIAQSDLWWRVCTGSVTNAAAKWQ